MSKHLLRAELLFSQSRYEQAIEELRQALAQDSQDPTALAMMAYAQVELENYQPAQELIRKAMSFAPDQPYVHYIAAIVLHKSNRNNEAMERINEALRLDPEDPRYYAYAAVLYLEKGQLEPALEKAEEGLRWDPENESCLNLRSMVLVRLGRKDEANRSLDAALQRNPDDSYTHANLGWQRISEGDHKQAAIHFREALRLDPENEWARNGIITALKAKHLFFRIFLTYILFMQRLDPRVQWGLIIGLYVMSRLVRGLGEAVPAIRAWTGVILMAYLTFAILTWITNPLFNLALMLDPFGRLVLTPSERRTSIAVGACVFSSIACAFGALLLVVLTDVHPLGLVFGVFAFLGFVVPISQIANCDSGWPRAVAVLATILILTMGLFCFVTLPPNWFWMPAELQESLGSLGAMMLLPFSYSVMGATFLFNFLPNQSVRK